MTTENYIGLIVVIALAFLAGWLIAAYRLHKTISGLRDQNARLEVSLDMEKK